jgi:hypothetical protein
MSHPIYWAIVPGGAHIIMSAQTAFEYGEKYFCKMFNPNGDFPEEYHILVDAANIYHSKGAAERKMFYDKLKGSKDASD